MSRAVPELFVCPDCGMEVEIWTDEIKGRCTSCQRIIWNKKMLEMSEKKLPEQRLGSVLKELTQFAYHLGASDARTISTAKISVEDHLANICLCNNVNSDPNPRFYQQHAGLWLKSLFYDNLFY